MAARIYTIAETCELLGLSRSSVARLLAGGDLRSFVLNKRSRRIAESEIERFITERQAAAEDRRTG